MNFNGVFFYTQDDDVLEYIAANKWDSKNLIVSPALEGTGKWLFQQSHVIAIDSYDVAVTMTT